MRIDFSRESIQVGYVCVSVDRVVGVAEDESPVIIWLGYYIARSALVLCGGKSRTMNNKK